VPGEPVRTALDLELAEGTVVADRVSETSCVFLAGLHRAERTIAERCQRAAESPQFWARKIPHFGGVGDQPLA
jgi:exodeoxyribonuclease V alpha subunit